MGQSDSNQSFGYINSGFAVVRVQVGTCLPEVEYAAVFKDHDELERAARDSAL